MNDLIKIENGHLAKQTIDYIKNIEAQVKKIKEQYDKFKSDLQKAMEQNNITKIEDETTGLRINYIASQENVEVFHKDEFKQDMPELYDEYCTMDGKKKAYITIKVK